MRVKLYIVIACLFGMSWNSQAQKAYRAPAQPEVVKCLTYEGEMAMRAAHPELGTIEEYEARIAPLVEETKRQMLSGERRAVITIPIVFHVVYSTSGNNLSTTYINAQLEQLNNDYRRVAGTTGSNTNPVGADTEIQFCMALTDPSGTPLAEPGINRVLASSQGWNNPPYTDSYVENTIYPNLLWDTDKYLNVMVASLSGGLLGKAVFPVGTGLQGMPTGGLDPTRDAVMVTRASVGSSDVPNPQGGQYNAGRTLSHEVGHWLGLRHIWGDGGCGIDDYCNDTPASDASNFGCPTTHVSCGTVDMVQNYMDYTDDDCMNIFTIDQKARMQTTLTTARDGLGTHAITACNIGGIAAGFTAEAETDCPALGATFTNTSSSNATTFTWDFGDGGSSNDENPTHTYATPGTYTVTLTVSDGVDSDDFSDDVTVTGQQTFDNLNNGTLVNIGSDGWGFIGGHNNYGDVAKAEYFDDLEIGSNLIGAYFLFAEASGNPSRQVKFNVWNNLGPGGEPGTIISTVSLPLSSLAVGTLTAVDFPDVTITGPVYIGVELVYATVGVQDTLAVATNSDGETVPTTAYELWEDGDWYSFNDGTGTQTTWELDVSLAIIAAVECEAPSDPPVAQFTGSPTTVCAGDPVAFNDQSTNAPTSWLWNFGDGQTSTQQNPTHTYATAGQKTVTLTATNASGSDSEVKTNYITVQAAPTGFGAGAADNTLCAGESTMLTMSGTFGGAYRWYDGTGAQISTSTAVQVTPSATTTYRATCDNGVCLVEAFVTVTVNPLPGTPTIAVNGANLTASSSSTGTFSWNFNGTPTGATGSTYTATQDGSYTVTITDANGCTATSAPASVVIPDPPVAAFTGSPTTICTGESVSFSDQSTNSPTSWNWNFGDGLTSTLQNPNHIYSTAGTYTVTLTAINSSGDDDEVKTNYITVDQSPTVSIAESGDDLVATASGSGTYQWQKDGVDINGATSDTYTPTATGDYTVIFTAPNGCTAESNEIAVVISAVFDNVLDAAIILYPNPVRDVLTIELAGYAGGDIRMTMMDVAGKALSGSTLTRTVTEVDMSALPAGVYLIKLETPEGGFAVRKVIKD